MPMTHICNSCGHDLTWIKAPPDPHYGLVVVVCPNCQSACTRCKPQILRSTRAARKGLRIGVFLAIQVIVLVLLLVAMFGTIGWLTDLTRSPGRAWAAISTFAGLSEDGLGLFPDPWEFRIPIVVLITLSIGVGGWMRGAHGHTRAITTLLIWLTAFGSALLIPVFSQIDEALRNQRSLSSAFDLQWIQAAGIFFLMTLPLILFGFLIGTRFRQAWASQHIHRIRRYRKKVRKNRMNHARPTHS